MDLLVIGLAALLGLAAGLLVARRGEAGGLAASGLIDRRLEGMSQDLDRRLAALDQRLYLGLDTIQEAQHQAAGTTAEVRERVAMVTGVAQQVLEQARDLARLEDLLRPPQARGALGEVLLEQLLAQSLPRGSYRMQHAFRSGARVDAVLVLGDALVPVDSKFPLEAFARMAALGEGDPARALHRRAFLRDTRQHVDDIAAKYICPDEGTFDFALCYVPSEAVYYEFLREEPTGESAFRHAAERRVFPVSPTTLYAYLSSVGLGLRGLLVEANARRVLDALAGLQGELSRFREDFEVLGKHLTNARAKWDDTARRLDRFDGRLLEAAGRAEELDAQAPGGPGAADGAAPTAAPAAAEADTDSLTGTG